MIEKIKKIILSPLAVVLILIVPTFIALLRPGYFPMHDDVQVMRIFEMDKCLKDGQIPCRWVPDMGFGYGYPQFNYYAPLPYYLMELVHIGGLGFMDSVKAGFILSFVLSAWGMYLLGKSLWGKTGGFVSSLFYAYLPYRAVDAYVRGAVGELYAFAFLPFVFWTSKGVISGKKNSALWLALSLAALLTSHNITSLIVIPFFIAWVFFWIYKSRLVTVPDLKKTLFRLFAAVIWGFGLSAFFVLPAFLEKGLVHIETITSGYFDYLAHFVTWGQLFFSSYWGYGVSQAGPWDEASFAIGIFHWSLALLAVVVAFVLKAKRKIPLILFWLASGVAAAFMAHGRSSLLWKVLPGASFVQFPWRYLILSGFFFSVAAGSLALFFPKGTKKIIYILPILIIVILFYSGNFRPASWLNIKDTDKLSGESWTLQQTLSIFDYLPIYVSRGPTQVAPEKPRVISGVAEITTWEKGTDWQIGTIRVAEKSTIEFPIYYFPNWEVEASGQKLDVRNEGELALIAVNVEPGEWELVAKLKDTPVRSLANIISLLALILIPFYLRKK